MKFALDNADKIKNLYLKQKLSLQEIADELKTNKVRIFRALKFLQIKIRDKSDAQRIAIKRGRKLIPTEGRERTEEEKKSIGKSMHNYWQNLDEAELMRRSKISKENWDKLPESKKREIHTKAKNALRKSIDEGSKMEKHIISILRKHGHTATSHRCFLRNANLEVDILIPRLNVVIEVDGPSHFDPIWGEDSLSKQRRNDNEKNQTLIHNGYCVIRLQCKYKSLTNIKMHDAADVLMETISEIEKGFPPKDKRLIKLEVL